MQWMPCKENHVLNTTASEQPLWLRVSVILGIVVLAVGMIYIVSRNGLEQRLVRIELIEQQLLDAVGDRFRTASELPSVLPDGSDTGQQDRIEQIRSITEGKSLDSMSAGSIAEAYILLDSVINDLVIDMYREHGRQVPSRFASWVRELQNIESEIADLSAQYNDYVTGYNRSLNSCINVLTAGSLHLSPCDEFHIESALASEF